MKATRITHETGYFDENTGTLHTFGSHRDPVSGSTVHTRSAFDLSKPDRHVVTMHEAKAAGGERKVFEGVFERK